MAGASRDDFYLNCPLKYDWRSSLRLADESIRVHFCFVAVQTQRRHWVRYHSSHTIMASGFAVAPGDSLL